MNSILNRFELKSIKRFINNARAVSKRSHKLIVFVMFDMVKCILKDHVGYMEYNLFHFDNKTQNIRDTYVTFDYSQMLFKTLNEKAYRPIFDDKLQFNKVFKDYLGRDFLDIANSTFKQFEKYCKGKDMLFAKPSDSCSGIGIYRKIDLKSQSSLQDLYTYLKDNNLYVEDLICQHKDMNKLNESSINTIRIVTLLDKKDKAHFVYALVRIGLKNMSVDNVGSGGIYTVLDENGTIINPCWSDKTISTYTCHPDTGFNLIGFKVPYFKKAVNLCLKAADVEKHVRYVGWDIAISEKGPIIVEGNPLPGYDMPQNYFVTNKDEGLKPTFERILND